MLYDCRDARAQSYYEDIEQIVVNMEKEDESKAEPLDRAYDPLFTQLDIDPEFTG